MSERGEREIGKDTIEKAEESGGMGGEKERGRTSVSVSRSFWRKGRYGGGSKSGFHT